VPSLSAAIQATWGEVDFEKATWTIPKQRMRGRNPHAVYLSRQALDILAVLHTCAAGCRASWTTAPSTASGARRLALQVNVAKEGRRPSRAASKELAALVG
jgi:integrase